MILKNFKKDPLFSFLILAIILFAVFFRTYNYRGRVEIQADNSRDAQVAIYAANHFKIPQIGQFSSAGPFFYGPWYYWFLEIVSFLPLGFLTPWYVMSAIYLLFIYLIFWVADRIGGKWLGALAALFAAISPGQISYSFSVWNPAIIPILVLSSIVLLIKFSESKKPIYIFLLSFNLSLASTVHFQSVLILPTLAVAMFSQRFSKKQFTRNLIYAFFGFLIPLLPLIYFDSQHNWYDAVSLFIFLAIDQFRIYVPNRWLTYATQYWPDAWSYIAGGNKYLGAAVIGFLGVFTVLNLKKFRQNKTFYLVAVTFIFEVILFRYYRGERFQYYSLFAHPAVILLTAWVCAQIFKCQRLLGVSFTLVIIFFTFKIALIDLNNRQVTLKEIQFVRSEIYAKYPNQNFDIYGCSFGVEIGHGLALLMYHDGRNATGGIKIGVCKPKNNIFWATLTQQDVTSQNNPWLHKTTSYVYSDIEEWWKEKPPAKGNLLKFLKEKLSPKCYPHC